MVVTGVGAVTAWGWSSTELWRGLLSGETSIAPAKRLGVEGHRTEVASEVPAASAEVRQRFRHWQQLSRADRFAVVAADEAVAQSGLAERLEQCPQSVGVFFSGSTAGMAEAELYLRALLGKGGRARIAMLRSQQLNGPGDEVARQLGVRGPVETVSSACASGTLALGLALDSLRDGDVEAAVVGGSDALCQLTYAGFNALRAVDPDACRPFRQERSGLSLGEGAGVLVLEPESSAEARGARSLARVLSVGASCDAHHMTAPHPQGRGAAAAVLRALEEANLSPAKVDFVNAHGTGTPLNDIAEWLAMEEVFGDRARAMPLTSSKGSIGHLLGSAGAVEAVATVLSLATGVIHPTAGVGDLDAEIEANLVRDRYLELAPPLVGLSTNLAFGGANGAVLLATAESASS